MSCPRSEPGGLTLTGESATELSDPERCMTGTASGMLQGSGPDGGARAPFTAPMLSPKSALPRVPVAIIAGAAWVQLLERF